MSDHVEKFVRRAVLSFVGDPPDTEFQCGYLGAMLQSRIMRSDFR